MLLRLFFLFLLSPGLAFALSKKEEMAVMGENYFAASEYETAEKNYKRLLNEKLTSIEKATVRFNLATTYLFLEKYSQAINVYEEAALDCLNDPFLKRRLYTNMMVSYLKWVFSSIEEESVSIEDINKDIERVNKVFDCEKHAREAEKEYRLVQGLESDDKIEDLDRLHKTYKELIVLLKKRKEELILKQTLLKEGLLKIKDEVEIQKKQTEILGLNIKHQERQSHFLKQQFIRAAKTSHLCDHVKNQYSDLIIKKMQTSEEEDSDVNIKAEVLSKQKLELFSQAQNNFLVALDYMKKGDVWKSLCYQSKALVPLQILEDLENNQDPLDGLLQKRAKLQKKDPKVLENPSYLSSLLDEHKEISQMSHFLTVGFEEELIDQIQALFNLKEEKQDVNLDQNEMKDLFIALTHLLQKRLKSPVDKEVFLSLDSEKDLHLYRQILEKEEGSLTKLYEEATSDHPNTSTVEARLWSLNQKFSHRYDYTKSSEEKKRIAKTLSLLKEAEILSKNIGTEGEKKQLQELLKQALLVWYPIEILKKDTLELSDKYLGTSKKAILEKEELKTLKESNSRLVDISVEISSHPLINKNIVLLSQSLKEAKQKSSDAIVLYDKEQKEYSKILLSDSSRWAKRAVRDYEKAQSANPQEILQEGLDEQNHALNLNNTYISSSNILDRSNLVNGTINKAQLYPLRSVEGFEKCLRDFQAKENNAISQDDIKEVLRLFELGRGEAIDAEGLLKQDNCDLKKVKSSQILVVKYWSDALEKLKDPNKNQNDTPNSSENQGSQSNQDNITNDQQQGQSKQINEQMQESSISAPPPLDIMQLLQEMQDDDNIRTLPKKEPKKGLKPW